MHEQNDTTLPATVQIAGAVVRRIAYNGEPVVTFAMVDAIHQRAEGTARRNFNDNRARFIDGEDCVALDQPNEIRTLGFTRPQGGTPASVVLITRRGYLKLVKPMNDDRAWRVQGEMIDRYFAVEKIAAVAVAPSGGPGVAREARLTMKMFLGIGKMCGLKDNQLVISANQATRKLTGIDYMGALGITHLEAPQQAHLLTPSDIGTRLGLTARGVNQGLITHDYQTAHRTAKGDPYYELTNKGVEAGGTFSDTRKQHHDGTPVRQLRWPGTIVKRLAVDMGVFHDL